MPANFKTYEAQARLLAAVIAAHPDLKLNYKAIAEHYGKSQSMSAIEHRFRPLRSAAQVLRDMVRKGMDPDGLDDIFDKNAIAELFGESTADGIQFQFRGVKQNAETLKRAKESGGDPATALANGKPVAAAAPTKATPRKRSRPEVKLETPTASTPSAKTDASSAVGTGSSSTKPRRNAKAVVYKEEPSTESDGPQDYDRLDSSSPTRYPKKVRVTPLKMSGQAQPPLPPLQFQQATVIDDGTSPSEMSIQTPDTTSNDDVTFLKQEAVNTNSAVSSFPSFPRQHRQPPSFLASNQGDSFTVSNPGSFSQQQPSIFGGPAASVHAHNSFPQPDARAANIVAAGAKFESFGSRDVDWARSDHDIFNGNYLDNDNGEI